MTTDQRTQLTIVHEEQYFWHQSYLDYGPTIQQSYLLQIETAEPRRRTRDLLNAVGFLDVAHRRRAEPVSRADLLRVHSEDYIDLVLHLNETGGWAGEYTPFGPGGFDVACLSAGGVHAALDDVVRGHCRTAFALVRPPGHHAERDRGRGYCIFANVAVAIEKIRADHGDMRVAVIDWDVHHGNGTQSIYYDDPNTLTISLHQDRLYPSESGGTDEIGGPEAIGTNLNIPLPPGSGRGAYVHAFNELVAPAIRHFAPEMIVIACGFDASNYDPNARMMLTATAFAELTRRARDLATECCEGRLALAQEGGYSALYAPLCGLAVVAALLDRPMPHADVLSDDDDPYQELQLHQRTAIADVVAAARKSGALAEPSDN
jgi:acetoin utilization deacetylase AcuC-like enzyme